MHSPVETCQEDFYTREGLEKPEANDERIQDKISLLQNTEVDVLIYKLQAMKNI